MGGSCENGDEHLGSIKNGTFLGLLSDYQLLKDSVPWSRGYLPRYFVTFKHYWTFRDRNILKNSVRSVQLTEAIIFRHNCLYLSPL
jgi:hypothetical protein